MILLEKHLVMVSCPVFHELHTENCSHLTVKRNELALTDEGSFFDGFFFRTEPWLHTRPVSRLCRYMWGVQPMMLLNTRAMYCGVENPV